MGVLLRGTQERFNPQIHTEGNSLTTMMKKHFAVKRKTFDLFNRYNRFQSWMYYTGRVNQGSGKGKLKKASEDLHDNAYRINYEGMDIMPAYAMGIAVFGGFFDAANPNPDMSANGITYVGGKTAGTITTNTTGSIAVAHDPANNVFGDKFNPNDKIALGAGLGINLIILKEGRRSSDGSHYVYDFKTIGPANAYSSTGLADGTVLTEGGSAFGEGSLKGYQRTNRNKWRINYSFITRYTLTMTGSAKKQKVAMIYNDENRNGKQMWEFDEILRGERVFRMLNEQALRYSRISMNPSTHAWFENSGTNELTVDGFKTESGIAAPVTGNGWIPEIEDNATFDYNPNNGLNHTLIEAITNVLSTRSPAGSSNNTFLAVTDRVGSTAFDRGMKKLMQFDTNSSTSGASNIVYNVSEGKEMKLGFMITEYTYLNNKFILLEDELLNHPALYSTNGGLVGTGNIYILNTTEVDGVPNFEILARSGRSMIKKNVDGMHSFDSAKEASNQAASGFDGCQCHMLSELMAVLYDARSCGILKATTPWNGGDLVGTTIAGENASTFIF